MDFVLAVRREFKQDNQFLDEVVRAIGSVDGIANISGDVRQTGRCGFDYNGQGGIKSLYETSGLDPNKVIIEPVIQHHPIQ